MGFDGSLTWVCKEIKKTLEDTCYKAEHLRAHILLLVTNGPVLFAVGFLSNSWCDFSVFLLFVGLLLALVLAQVHGFAVGWISVGSLPLASILLGLFLLLFLRGRRGGVLLGHLLSYQLGVYPGFPVGPKGIDSQYERQTNTVNDAEL